MARRPSPIPSPILGAAAAAIAHASAGLVSKSSPFRHTFEAATGSVEPDPDQPRRTFDPAALEQLAATMAECGQLQPVLLRPHPARAGGWVIVAGERRWRAAQSLGWPTLLAIEHDGDPEVAALLENLQRVDLSVVEQARGIKRLLAGKGWTQSRAAETLGQSRAEVSAVLRVLTLPDDVLQALASSELDLPRSTLIELARIEDPQRLRHLLALAREGRLTVRALRAAKDGVLPGAPEPAPPEPGKRISMAGIERLADNLVLIRQAGQRLEALDRNRLARLRMEIDALLDAPRR